jgi:hypothetical protein
MFGEKFADFCENLVKCSQLPKENQIKNKNNKEEDDEEIINDYNINDKSKSYIEKHITALIDGSIKHFLENNNNSQKYSFYLKMIQNIYCDISEFSKYFPIFKSLKMALKLYFIVLRTYYYNNQKLEKIFVSKESLTIFIDYFFKEIMIYTIKIYPNIDINNKSSINELNINKTIIKCFLGDLLPFTKKDNEDSNNKDIYKNNIPMNILYNINEYRYDIMRDIEHKGFNLEKYFEKQKNWLKKMECDVDKNEEKIHLGLIIYFLCEIKEKYFIDRFIRYLELTEDEKKIVLSFLEIK